ncbi:hypothetical protein HOD08_01150 [bacterium]|nr:hypothetical protein [bacterium]
MRALNLILLICVFQNVESAIVDRHSSERKHTSQTTLIERQQIWNYAAEAITSRLSGEKRESAWGTNVNFTGIWSPSIFDKDIGKGFGVAGLNTFTVKDSATASQIDVGYLIHTKNAVDSGYQSAEAIVTLEPHERIGAVQTTWFQHLDFIVPKSFAGATVVFAHSHHNTGLSFSTKHKDEFSGSSIEEFLAGTFENTTMGYEQNKLKYGKITAQDRETFGFSHVSGKIGYHLIDKNPVRVSIAGVIEIPTAKVVELEYLFDPRIGSRHLGIGPDASFDVELYRRASESSSFFLHGKFGARYRFSAEDKRIANVKDFNWGHYALTQKDAAVARTPLEPAANILAHRIHVEKGISIDGRVTISYRKRQDTFAAGYAFHCEPHENNKFKETWTDNLHGIVNTQIFTHGYAWDGSSSPIPTIQKPFAIYGNFGASLTAQSYKTLNLTDLNIELPESFLHTFFASAGKTVSVFDDKMKIALSVGAAYQVAFPKRMCHRSVEMWGQLAISF